MSFEPHHFGCPCVQCLGQPDLGGNDCACARCQPGQPLWLGLPIRNGASAGMLTLSNNMTSYGHWAVYLEGGHAVAFGTRETIDAVTRAWLRRFIPLMKELDMIQEAM